MNVVWVLVLFSIGYNLGTHIDTNVRFASEEACKVALDKITTVSKQKGWVAPAGVCIEANDMTTGR